MATVKVRVAVAVDEAGNWGSIGFSRMDPTHRWMASENLDGMLTRWFWVDAELPLPTEQAETVTGVVGDADAPEELS